MNEPVRWGILGVAQIALNQVIPALQSAANCRIVAIASRERARADDAARRLGIARAHGSYEALLADPEIEAIYNPLPNSLHVDWTIRAAEAGKHVLCEKPIGMDARDAERLLAVRARSGVMLQEAFMYRHHPRWRRVVELVHGGAIGKVELTAALFTYNRPKPDDVRNIASLGGGVILDIGAYGVHSARRVRGREPLRVMCRLERHAQFGTDRLVTAMLDFGDVLSTFALCNGVTPMQEMRIFGSEARLDLARPYVPAKDRPTEIVIDRAKIIGEDATTIETFAPADQYAIQCAEFAARLRKREGPEFPIEDAIANMRVLDALKRSATSGVWEQV
jgi:predicted dehydrogenase